MKNLKEKFTKLGYKQVTENEFGISMVKEDISTCLIILKDYDKNQLYNDSELRSPLDSRFSFAQKGTICVFINHDESLEIEDIEADEFNALKVHESHIDCIPHRKEDISIVFKPIESIESILVPAPSSYVISPFRKMDGLMSQDFYRYLANAKDGDVVRYPEIISGMMLSWFRYVANKQYSIQTI